MNTGKKALLMLNLGTPDSPGVIDVGKYLSEFLTDSRMINIPSLLRYLLVNLIIVPTRSFSSSKGYKELWTKRGSPLKFHMEDLVKKVSKKLNQSHEVFYAMRYKNPSINSVLKKIEKKGFNEIILFPIFPQYSSATTGSFLEKTFKEISSWTVIPKITTIDQFYDNPKFINAFVENIKKFDLKKYDKVIFSYHGLPVSQLNDVYEEGLCSDRDCEKGVHGDNYYCYKAACFETTKLINKKIKLPNKKIVTSFQSRLDSGWVKPFSDKVIKDLAESGVKSLLVVSPSFTIDCLETVVEIGSEYKELFEEHGGQKLDYVPSLNSNDSWVECIIDLVK